MCENLTILNLSATNRRDEVIPSYDISVVMNDDDR